MEGKVKGLAATLGTIILWSIAPVLIKMLSLHFDPITQNFYRYFSSSLLLTSLSLTSGEIRRLTGHLRKLVIPASFVFLYQTLLVYGIYMTDATTASILMKLNVVFTSILAFLLFRDERAIITARSYLLGALLAFTGAAGIVTDAGGSPQLTINTGAALVVSASLFWACYVTSIKFLVSDVPPLPLSAATFTLSSAMFLPLMTAAGNPAAPLQTTPEVNLLLILSGILCVGVGNWLNYIAIKSLGAAIPSTLQMTTPLLTGVFSVILTGEEITAPTLLFGGMLLAGSTLIIRLVVKRPG